jgi:hypothetical protein
MLDGADNMDRGPTRRFSIRPAWMRIARVTSSFSPNFINGAGVAYTGGA